ncbi:MULTISPECIES: hypothetical protein [Pseudomonas]|uniref:hypothetical protein n=1 Tax=Pseudomonas TaxID=286 RepID=UPI0007313B9E|nr:MULTISPECIES: hypothetical protein [Pseudomonas]KTC16710.1 hypothetical protein AO388_17500 [Pseudomonas sp. ICMP 10191]QQQ52403.1 hypothetical protein JJQ97_09385 [Pseudomonas syringae]
MRLLQDMIRAAMNHQGGVATLDGNGDVAQFRAVPPAAVRYVTLGENLPVKDGVRTVSAKELRSQGITGRLETLPANDYHGVGSRSFLPAGTAVGKQNDLSVTLLNNSLVAQAGARIIIVPGPEQATTGPGVNVEHPAAFVVVEAGKFEAVADGADLAASEIPLSRTELAKDVPAVGVRFDLTRRQLKDLSEDVTTDAIWTSIGMGMANEADRLLLAVLNTGTLNSFSLSGVASSGLRFDELRAIAGTSATGAVVGTDGILRVDGVRAELTSQATGTVLGAFSRAAIAIGDDLRLTALRTLNGGCQITCFVNMEALVPDLSAFWKAA